MSKLKIDGIPGAARPRRRMRFVLRSGLLIAAAAAGTAQAQKVTSNIYSDDEFKVFISTSPTTAGIEFAQGAGWAVRFQDDLYLYAGATTYYLHVWVRDIGGGPTGFLGEFHLTNHRGCRFANGGPSLLTGVNGYWRVSDRQPVSTPLTGGPIASVPYFNNVIPAFAPAKFTPTDLGANTTSGNGWPSAPTPKPFAGVSSSAHWIGSPGKSAGPEMWFTTTITCKTATLPTNVDPN
ncbi:MAG: hypothetical protein QOJ91_1194 [Sphingomonadales bacterium]|nr:hypothetical protein [Sphingomonadales bacterium]